MKRLYDFIGIYIIFWSQNSHYQYLPIFTDIYRYFTDILRIIFQKFQHKRACSTVTIFRWKNRYFPIFRRKIDDFTDFSSAFSFLCQPKTDFSTIYRPKKTIFCSLVVGDVSKSIYEKLEFNTMESFFLGYRPNKKAKPKRANGQPRLETGQYLSSSHQPLPSFTF